MTPAPAPPVLDDSAMAVALLAHAERSLSSPEAFEVWLQTLAPYALKFARAGGPTAGQDFLLAQDPTDSTALHPFAVACAAGMVARWGWDPARVLGEHETDRRDRIDYPLRREEGPETFLAWLAARNGTGTSVLPAGVWWPTTAEAWRAFEQTHRPAHTQEWLLARMVAEGPNPWTLEDPDARDEPLLHSLWFGHPRVAAQLLALPGAPTLSSVLERVGPDNVTFWNLLSGQVRHSWETLSDLARHVEGWQPSLDQMHGIGLDSFRFLVDQGRVNHDQSRALEARWAHTERDFLYAFQRLGALPHLSWDADTVRAKQDAFLVERLLRHKGFVRYDGFERGRGPDWVSRRWPDGNGGHWTVVEAMLATQVSWGNSNGGSSIPLDQWFGMGCEGQASTAGEPTNSPWLADGGLRCVLEGPDPADGLPKRGLWALALLGKVGSSDQKRRPEGLSHDVFWPDHLAAEAAALGMDDWAGWARDSLDDALAATRWLLAHGDPEHQAVRGRTLAGVWAKAFERFPAWMEGRPSALADLLATLGRGQVTRWPDLTQWVRTSWPPRNGWEELMFQVSTHVQTDTWKMSAATADDRALALEMLLGLHHPGDFDKLATWLGDCPKERSFWVRIQAWLDDTGGPAVAATEGRENYRLTGAHLAAVRAALLAGGLDVPHGAAPRPRL